MAEAAQATTLAGHVLDNAVWGALTGPHARFAEVAGRAARYRADVSPFAAVADGTDERAWADLARLAGPGASLVVSGAGVLPPPSWEVLWQGPGVQMVDAGVDAADDPEAVVLTAADVPEMLALVARTDPGPFLPGTVELGTYLGIRRDGGLVAMAGERMHPAGWTEISGVCTDEAYRGQGLAGRLVRAVAAGIRGRGERPFLHAVSTNTAAIRLYAALGFRERSRPVFTFCRVPD